MKKIFSWKKEIRSFVIKSSLWCLFFLLCFFLYGYFFPFGKYSYSWLQGAVQLDSPLVLEERLEDEAFVEALLLQMTEDKVGTEAQDFHGAASDDRWSQAIDRVCTAYKKHCAVLDFEGKFSSKERYVYTILSVYFLHVIDRNLDYDRSLWDALHKITIRGSRDGANDSECVKEKRGCANHNMVVLNAFMIKSPWEFAYTLTHELGHVLDLGVLEWSRSSYDSDYTEFGQEVFRVDDPSLDYYALSWMSEKVRKKWAKRQNFCSLYAMTNMFEDFAECLLMYQDYHYAFKFLAKEDKVLRQKFLFFSRLFDGDYLFANAGFAKESMKNPDKRVWDLTRAGEE